jgi:hypothetical protein
MPWIRVFTDFDDNPKTIRLKQLLKNHLADAYPQRLWRWALKHAPGGTLAHVSVECIAKGCGVQRRPRQFVEALIEAGFIDRDTMQIHDWNDGSGQYETMTISGRARVAKHRRNAHVTVTPTSCNAHVTFPDPDPDPDPDLNPPLPPLTAQKTRKGGKAAKTPPPSSASNGFGSFKDWAYDAWLKAGGKGKWEKGDWVMLNRGYESLADTEASRKSWSLYLTDASNFYMGHYPRKWGSEPARWLQSNQSTDKTAGNLATCLNWAERKEAEDAKD